MREPQFIQLHRPDGSELRDELSAAMMSRPARISPKFLYDALGSRLFEAITELPEYYVARAEAEIFEQHTAEIAAAVGDAATLIDLGAGSCRKAARLFVALRPARYVAVDISTDFLRHTLAALQRQFPDMDMLGVGLDFSRALNLPPQVVTGRPVFFYPGSSIGNFAPDEALAFLRCVRATNTDGGLLIGVDLVKPSAVLQAAYDDALGITAAFNLNLLLHLNKLINSDFELRQWRHIGLYNAEQSRAEMHLEARETLSVHWSSGERAFVANERIHTENSYKYTPEGFAALLSEAGFSHVQPWFDTQRWFAVFWAAG